jgi:hypothetical protein
MTKDEIIRRLIKHLDSTVPEYLTHSYAGQGKFTDKIEPIRVPWGCHYCFSKDHELYDELMAQGFGDVI